MRKSIVAENRKYMWDGVEYKDEGEANAAAERYAADRFEVQRIVEKEAVYLFTRRVVTEIRPEGAPP